MTETQTVKAIEFHERMRVRSERKCWEQGVVDNKFTNQDRCNGIGFDRWEEHIIIKMGEKQDETMATAVERHGRTGR